MSLLHTPMFNNDHFKPGHVRSRSYNELISQFKTVISSSSPNVVPPSSTPTGTTKGGVSRNTYVKKRSYSDLMKDTPSLGMIDESLNKRSRTAPPSPPYDFPASSSFTSTKGSLKPTLNLNNHVVIRSRSLSPNKRTSFPSNPISPSDSPNTSPITQRRSTTFDAEKDLNSEPKAQETSGSTQQKPAAALTHAKAVHLPSISSVLQSTPLTKVKLNPITPTVSLDYFDTYKPNDENWRYELLDSITKTSKQFNLNRYNYLNRAGSQVEASKDPSSLSSYSTSSCINSGSNHSSAFKISKPNFNSKISSKIAHPREVSHSVHKDNVKPKARKSYSERKIRFPFESNYTYLNKTYMTDVQRYPEYLELAESLISLSQSDKNSYVYSPPQEEEPEPNYPTQEQHYHVAVSPNRAAATIQHTHQQQQPYQHIQSSIPVVTSLPRISTIIPSPSSIASSHHTTVSPIMSALPLPPQQQYISTHQPQQQHSHHQHHVYHQHPQQHYTQTQVQTQNGYNTFLSSYEVPSTPQKQHKTTPLTPPSSKSKSRSDLLKSPPKSSQQHNTRVCISCGSDQSPCWRPSWSIKEGQLCNSCGLRYKKTAARCLNKECKKIPAKGEWSLMQSKGKSVFEDGNEGYSCLDCAWRVEVKKS